MKGLLCANSLVFAASVFNFGFGLFILRGYFFGVFVRSGFSFYPFLA
jgi:hypothetical protein